VPDRILLPVRIEKISFYSSVQTSEVIITAIEKESTGNDYIYDINVTDKAGILLQEWHSVVFRAIQRRNSKELPVELAEIVLQRKVDQLSGKRDGTSIHLIERSVHDEIPKRTDGKPLPENGVLSKSHSNGTTLLVQANGQISCDMEAVVEKPQSVWQPLFQPERVKLIEHIQKEIDEDFSSAATRVWCAMECIRKAGLQDNCPLLFCGSEKDNTVYIEAGDYKIITYKSIVKKKGATVFAVLVNPQYEKEI
jgi:enediyne polyketide synthase